MCTTGIDDLPREQDVVFDDMEANANTNTDMQPTQIPKKTGIPTAPVIKYEYVTFIIIFSFGQIFELMLRP